MQVKLPLGLVGALNSVYNVRNERLGIELRRDRSIVIGIA